MKRVLFFLLIVALASWVSAQEMSAEDIVGELETAIGELDDARFSASGAYMDEAGESQSFSAEVEVIFGDGMMGGMTDSVARVTFSAPEELAGNVVVLEGDTLRNYVAAEDAVVEMAMGEMAMGEMGMGEMNAMPDVSLFGMSLDEVNPLSLDLSNLFQGWTPEILETAEDRYELRFVNPDADLEHIDAVIVQQDDGWMLEELRFVRDGSSLLETTLSEVETNVGLMMSALTDLPE